MEKANRPGWNCPFCGGTDLYLYPNQEQCDAALRHHVERYHPKLHKLRLDYEAGVAA